MGLSGSCRCFQVKSANQNQSFILCPERDQERIGDCARSAMRSRYGDEYYRLGKSCEMVQIANECVDSINGNCATDAGFSRALSQLQQECDRQRYQECINKIEECARSAM